MKTSYIVRDRIDSPYEGKYRISFHARDKMEDRKISLNDVENVITYGRVIDRKRARNFVVDENIIQKVQKQYGCNISRYHGMRVICIGKKVLTTFLDKNVIMRDKKIRKKKFYRDYRVNALLREIEP